jgi:TolB-like protein/DNA-binding winged helix-turn-helix (wHTH) protein/tetratricopeptide (TPR) repeat protein
MNAENGSATGSNGGNCYRFGTIVVDAAAYTLTRDGQPQALEPKAFAVLLILLQHPGELVRHGDLLDAVWGHRHVTPGVLTRAIAQLRHVLEDDSQHPRYIQTQHGLGYRFVGELLSHPGAAEPVTDSAVETVSTGDTHRTADDPSGAGASVTSSSATIVAAQPTRQRRIWLRRSWPLAIVLLMALGAWLLFRQAPLTPARPGDASIAVLPFSSLTQDKSDTYFAEGLAVELHDALAGIPGLKVAACRADSVCGMRGADVRKMGRLLGVATVLDADVRREGQRVRVNARLSDTKTGFTLWSGSYDRELTGVFALQDEIAQDVVRSLLGVLPRDPQGLSRRLRPTTSIAAYDAYLHGVQQLQQPDGDKKASNAISFFQEALAADPGFARAQAGICRAEIIGFEGEHDATAFDRAQASCQRAAQMDPNLREVSLALGDLYRARDDNTQAIEHYRKALEAPALRPDAYIGLARAESARGNSDVALDYFERARQLRPGDPTTYKALGFQYYLRGDMTKAIEGYVTATTLDPDNEGTWASLGGLYMRSGDSVRAVDAYTRSLAIKPSYDALLNLGTLRFEQRSYTEAASLYRRAAELEGDDYRIWGNLADALAAVPATAAQAREPYQHAAQMAQQYVDIKPSDAHALGVLAWYRANLGQEEAARQLIQRADALGAEPGEVAFWAAQSLAVLGDVDGARKWLLRAQEGGVSAQQIESSPTLKGLLAKEGEAKTQSTAGPTR